MLSLVENWCNEDNITAVAIPVHVQADSFCCGQRLYGGSMIFTKLGLVVKQLPVRKFSVEMHVEISGILVSLYYIK